MGGFDDGVWFFDCVVGGVDGGLRGVEFDIFHIDVLHNLFYHVMSTGYGGFYGSHFFSIV